MALTPLDIHHKEFKPARFGGYKEEEVDSFLDQIADELEKYIQENVDLKQQIDHSKKRLSEFEEMQTSLQSALLAATKSAEAVKEQAKQESETIVSQARGSAETVTRNAKEEADSVVKDAQEQARQMLVRAQNERQKLEKTLDRLVEVKGNYVQSIRDLADENLERISKIELEEELPSVEEPDEPEPQGKTAVKKPPPLEKPPVETMPSERPVVEKAPVEKPELEMPPVVNETSENVTPSVPPVTRQVDPPMKAKVQTDGERVESIDRPEVISVESSTVQKPATERTSTATPVETRDPAAASSRELTDRPVVKKSAAAVSVKEEPEAKPLPSSKLVEEVLSMEGDEGIFGDFTEDGNGAGQREDRKSNRKEKRDKHFFWE